MDILGEKMDIISNVHFRHVSVYLRKTQTSVCDSKNESIIIK